MSIIGRSAHRGVALALQGGGAHGAFTWGAADRLIEDGLCPDRIGGVSSGALLGVALAQGWAQGGPTGARAAMAGLWREIGRGQASTPDLPWFWGGDFARHSAKTMLRLFGPARAGAAPLRTLIADLLDPGLLRHPDAPRLVVSATEVETGRATVFDNATITADVLLASCCLPLLFPAVRIDGRAHWDGAYSGNPPLWPLLQPEPPAALILVRGQATRRAGTPEQADSILGRVNDLAFTATLNAELRALPPGLAFRDVADDALFESMSEQSRISVSAAMIEKLFEGGRRAAAERREGGSFSGAVTEGERPGLCPGPAGA